MGTQRRDHRWLTQRRDPPWLTQRRDYRWLTQRRDHRWLTQRRDHRWLTQRRDPRWLTQRRDFRRLSICYIMADAEKRLSSFNNVDSNGVAYSDGKPMFANWGKRDVEADAE